jgi:hypothetical protein
MSVVTKNCTALIRVLYSFCFHIIQKILSFKYAKLYFIKKKKEEEEENYI